MRPVLLIDFGSTYTKLTAVDLDAGALLGTAAAYTTVQTDINDGLRQGLQRLEEKTGKLEFVDTFACSSAAGGLRMIASGLVPELTSEAAKLASLGAGAKIIGLYSFELTEDDIEEIRAASTTPGCSRPCPRRSPSWWRATGRPPGSASGFWRGMRCTSAPT